MTFCDTFKSLLFIFGYLACTSLSASGKISCSYTCSNTSSLIGTLLGPIEIFFLSAYVSEMYIKYIADNSNVLISTIIFQLCSDHRFQNPIEFLAE